MPRLDGNKDRINTVMPKLIVYRMTREELSSSIVSIVNASGDNATFLRFTMNGTGAEEWTKFKEWWKKNNNTIVLGCKIWNIGGSGNQNKGYYWCPTYRTPNPLRTDNYTNYLEFIITRNDTGIFNTTAQTIYEFYFINLTH